jgi:Protein of unknown function (DUF1579)
MSAPAPEIQLLGLVVGRWRTDGHIIGDPPVPIVGSDIYEWLPGGFFIVHHVDVLVGEQRVQGIEIIGDYDAATDSFTGRTYDNQGNITVMHARAQGRGVFTFAGRGDVAREAQPTAEPTAAVRSTLSVNPEQETMRARWERSADGES